MKRRETPKRWCCLLETILLNRALAGVYFQTVNLNGDRQAMEKKKVPKITDLRYTLLSNDRSMRASEALWDAPQCRWN